MHDYTPSDIAVKGPLAYRDLHPQGYLMDAGLAERR
jgi:hypothetical protein